MANTAAADSQSAMAVLFNPGALAFAPKNKIALSGNAYFNFSVKYAPYPVYQQYGKDITFTGFNSLPSSVVSTYRVGNHVLAASVLIPDFSEISALERIEQPDFSGTMQLSAREQDLWLGLSWSTRLSERWSAGVTLFSTHYSRSTATNLQAQVSSAGVATQIGILETTSALAHSLVAVAGIYFEPTDNLSLGLKSTAPSIRMTGSGKYYQQTKSITGSAVTLQTDDRGAVSFYYTRPADFALGGRYKFYRLGVFLDLALQMPISYEEFPGASQPQKFSRNLLPKISTGFDLNVSAHINLLAGFSWIPFAQAPLETRSESRYRVNDILATSGLQYADGPIRMGIGGFILYGAGRQVIDANSGSTGTLGINGFGGLLSSAYEF